MKLKSAVAVAALIATSTPAFTAALPLCPRGKVGDWLWYSTAQRAEIEYNVGEWNFGPDVELPQETRPAIKLHQSIGWKGDKRGGVTVLNPPKGYKFDIAGKEFSLFNTRSHTFKIGLAAQGENADLMVAANYNRASLGLFGYGGSFDDGHKAVDQLIRKAGVTGLFLIRPDPNSGGEEPFAFVTMPEDGRVKAWTAAQQAHRKIAAESDKGAGCKRS